VAEARYKGRLIEGNLPLPYLEPIGRTTCDTPWIFSPPANDFHLLCKGRNKIPHMQIYFTDKYQLIFFNLFSFVACFYQLFSYLCIVVTVTALNPPLVL